MKRILLALAVGTLCGVLTAVAGAQPPPDESNLPESEKRIPPGHHCLAGPPLASDTKGHECACKYSCSIDANGTVSEHEDPSCLSFCHLNKRVCVCHADEACAGAVHGNALINMDGHVVAMKVRR